MDTHKSCHTLWLFLAAMFVVQTAALSHPNVTFDVTELVVFAGQEWILNVTILSYNGTEELCLSFESENTYTFTVLNSTECRLLSDVDDFPLVYQPTVRGKNIGISNLRVLASIPRQSEVDEIATLVVKVNIGNNIIQGVLQYVLYAPIMGLFFMMGTAIDLDLVVANFRKPFPLFIGFVCQFGIMPALSLGIAKMLSIDGFYALGLLMVGCSPGGRGSNDFVLLLDADFVLSITMTTCSTILALGMMPLNIFLYTPLITESTFGTPIGQIALQSSIILSPMLLGVVFKYKFPKLKDKTMKILKPVVAVIIVMTIGMTTPFILYIFRSPGNVYLAVFLLPACGGLIGGITAKLARLNNKQAMAVAFETGIQNSGIAIVILGSVYPSPESDLARAVPLLAMLFTVFICIAVVLVNMLLKRTVWKGDGDDEDDKDKLEDDHVEDDHVVDVDKVIGINNEGYSLKDVAITDTPSETELDHSTANGHA